MTDARRAILDASLALIAEQGVRAVSFREVARRAGVSHQTPYHHFGDHHGILRAIATEGFAGLTAAMRQAAAAQADPMDALHASGVAYVHFARDHVGHFRVMFQGAIVDVHDPNAPVLEAKETSDTLAELAAAAHASGYGGGLDVDALARLCWTTVHGLASLAAEGVLAGKGLSKRDEDALVESTVASLSGLLGRAKTPRTRAAKKSSRR